MNLKEITKEEVLTLENKTEYIIYNPLTDSYKKEIAGKNDIAHNKYCYEKIKFFLEVAEDDK